MVEMHPVISSQIKAVWYDEDTQRLTVEFHNWSQYAYLLVPQSVADWVLEADSVWKFFNANVKTKYSYEKIG